MDPIDRRRFLIAVTTALAACDRIAFEVTGRDDVKIDEEGNVYIPPISGNETFYVYQYGSMPTVDPATWTLRFFDRDEQIGSIDAAFLETLAPREIELTLQCIGATVVARRIDNAIWKGLPLSEVLEAAGIPGPSPGTVEIKLVGADQYHASVPVEDLDEAPVWLVWGMNGEPLPEVHGAPARLMIPGRYGVKNLKWITEIGWIDHVHTNFWDQYGWDHDAAYKVNGFIHLPAWGDVVEAPVTVLGTSFAGKDPVVKVELTDDGGKTWQECTLEYAPGPNIWALWRLEWKPAPGDYEIQIRATTEGGKVTNMNPSGSNNLAGYDGGMLIPLTVT